MGDRSGQGIELLGTVKIAKQCYWTMIGHKFTLYSDAARDKWGTRSSR